MAYDATLTDPGAIQSAMNQNSDAYASADHATQQQLHADNLSYAAKTGQTYNSAAGTYSAPTPSTNVAYPTGAGQPFNDGMPNFKAPAPNGATGDSKKTNLTNDNMPTMPNGNTFGGGAASGTTFPDSNKVIPAGQNPFTQLVPGYGPSTPPATTTPPAPAPVTVPNPTGQSDGSLHLNVNGTAGTDVPVFKGTSFESGSDLAKQLGLDYKADPTTGEITIGGTKVMPTSYDKQGNAMVGVRQVANALGYQIGYDDKTKTITVTGKPTTPPGGTGPDINQPWQPPDMSQYQGNMMPYATFNGDMNTYYNQAHAQLDAQYQQQKQALLDKQQTDISASDESMNKRGIYSSGVAQSVEDDLRNKTTQAVANVLSNQMAAVAKTAQGLYDTAYKQYLDGNKFALDNNKANITSMLAVEKQSFNEYIQTHKLTDAETNAANAEFDKQAALIQKETQAELPYKYQTANNAADNANKAAIAQLPYQQMTAYQQASTDEKASMDKAVNYFKQQGINVDYAKLFETITHDTATENETATHDTALEDAAANKPVPAPVIDPKDSFSQAASLKSQLTAKLKTLDHKTAAAFVDVNKGLLIDSDYRDLQTWVDTTFKK